MAEFLLIHGSGHGAWCWHRVIPALAALGHQARAIDLPRSAPASLDTQARAILAALPRRALVVGHSAGGFPITAAAEIDPTNIAALVYLCAYLPAPGLSLAQMRRAAPLQPLLPAIRRSPDRSAFSFDPAQTGALFYHDCPPEDRALAGRLLVPEPIAPQETPLALTRRSQSLPRHYILCSDDRAIPPERQQAMAQAVPPPHRHRLDCSHSPFFARPKELAEILDRIAQGAFGPG